MKNYKSYTVIIFINFFLLLYDNNMLEVFN